jgi:hypothetical protein
MGKREEEPECSERRRNRSAGCQKRQRRLAETEEWRWSGTTMDKNFLSEYVAIACQRQVSMRRDRGMEAAISVVVVDNLILATRRRGERR